MKLVSLIEEDGQEPEQPLEQTPEIKTYNRIAELLKALKDTAGFFQKPLEHPQGRFELRYHTKLDPGQHKAESYGSIELGIYFYPDMQIGIVPEDILKAPMDDLIDTIKKMAPDLAEESPFNPRELLNKVEVKVYDLYIKFGRALYNINDLMDRPTYNTKVRGLSIPLGDFLYEPSITEQCIIDDLPRFDPHYKDVHDHLMRRTATVVKAYHKGKWRGHTYDIGTIGGHNTILLLPSHRETSIVDGIIKPSITPHLSMASPSIDGYFRWANSEDYPLSDEEVTEFNKHMDKIFGKYGIKYT